GAGRDAEALFRDVPWSTSAVTRVTAERARERGLTLHVLPLWYDLDDAASLVRARRDATRERCPALARVLEDLGGRIEATGEASGPA
ncbi:MAG TPA: DUF2064 domain-containing protein, partial [Candidatus Eisenbacteria bacterium]